MGKIIYRTVIQFEILSEEPIEQMSLNDIAYEATLGSLSGRFLEDVVTNEVLTGTPAVDAIKAQGSDPAFFFMDNDGNDLVD